MVEFDRRGNGTGRVLRTEPLGAGLVVANDHFVVETYTATQDPIILVDGEWLDLDDLIENLDGFVISDAADMNKRGDIVGTGTLPTGEGRGFILEIQDGD